MHIQPQLNVLLEQVRSLKLWLSLDGLFVSHLVIFVRIVVREEEVRRGDRFLLLLLFFSNLQLLFCLEDLTIR